MSSKNTALKLYTFLFLTCFTLFWGQYQRFGLGLFSYMAADFALFLVAAVFSALIILQNGGRFYLDRGSKLFAGLFLLTCVEVLHTRNVAATQPLYLTLSEAFPYISVCLEAFALSRLIRRKEDLDRFMDAIEAASILIACFSILQFAVYPEIIIFPTNSLPLRNGLNRIYIGGGSVLSMGWLISVGNLFSRRKGKIISLVNCILVFVTLALVRQARSNTVCLLIVLLAGLLEVSNIPKTARPILFVTITGVLAGVMIFAVGETPIAALIRNDAGFRARLQGLEFFMDKFKEYPVLGMGFITTSGNLDPVSYSLLCSSSGYRFDRSDLGIVGVLNMFGLLGIVWYAAFLHRIGKNAKQIRQSNGMIHGKLILWYLIVTSVNLIVMTMQMSMMIALTVVLTDKMREFSCQDLRGSNDEIGQDRFVWSESAIGK